MTDELLRRRVRRAMHRATPASPPFATSWHAAVGRFGRGRRRYAVLAASLLLAAVVVLTQPDSRQADEPRFVAVADLLGTTYWAAPSDVLLPRHPFDIYQELPEMFEST